MKNYTITVNGNVYDVTVEENAGGAAPAPAAAPAPKAPAAPKAAPAPKPAAKAVGAGAIQVKAGAAGKVFKIEANVGQNVKRGDAVVIIEAMKMETNILAPVSGEVDKIYVNDAQQVKSGELIATLK